jgi:DNA-binding GntR family transcriptional regulator
MEGTDSVSRWDDFKWHDSKFHEALYRRSSNLKISLAILKAVMLILLIGGICDEAVEMVSDFMSSFIKNVNGINTHTYKDSNMIS